VGLSQVLDLVLETLEPLHRLVVLVLQQLEVVAEADLEGIVLGANIIEPFINRTSESEASIKAMKA